MDILQEKYISLISSRLPKFTVKHQRPLTVNFRCVICGDSAKNKSKARGYIYVDQKGAYWYKCHNGCSSRPFERFLKHFDYNLFEQYQKEKVKGEFTEQKVTNFSTAIIEKDFTVNNYQTDSRFKQVKSISELLQSNYGRQFIEGRKIPAERWTELYLCPKFKDWVNQWVPKFNKESISRGDYQAIIIPITLNRKLVGFQGRVLDGPKDLRYITISLLDNVNLIYNKDNIDWTKKVYVTEGPFDSMFLPNAIAAMGGSIHSTLNKENIEDKSNVVIVYDNEPRSKFNIKHIEDGINAGYSVFIWPDQINQKDLNKMAEDGWCCLDLKNMIDKNTYSGLQALLALNNWKKINKTTS